MSIDWTRAAPEFIAQDRDKSYWRFRSVDVVGDLLALRRELPKYPKHQLIACENAILAIFDGATVPKWSDLGAKLDAIADNVLDP